MLSVAPRLARRLLLLALATGLALASGCAAFPDRLVQPVYHNPFPQLHKVAVLPFYNQSREPTVDGEQIANLYYEELQAIPGFEVVPVGVARQMILASGFEPRSAGDFQKLAQLMRVDAVIVGSVTDYSPYYPPRMGIAVDWYAANPGFHPIPNGYGLPWNTPDEEYIPQQLVEAAEFELAREQLKTQTPEIPSVVPAPGGEIAPVVHRAATTKSLPATEAEASLPASVVGTGTIPTMKSAARELPADWPNPAGFVPPPPQANKPDFVPNRGPIISHTKIYEGSDSEFTQRLASYYYFRDDARFGGWQAYLQRPDDFAKFCCHLHLTETLAARGGAGESRVVWRWPIGRYER